MSFETLHRLRDPTAVHPPFPELTVVVTLHPARTLEGREVPAGTRGTVVGIWGGGRAYEVEFARPVAGVATMPADALRAA